MEAQTAVSRAANGNFQELPSGTSTPRVEVLVAACDSRIFLDFGLSELALPALISEQSGEIFVTQHDCAEARLSNGIVFRPDAPLVCALALSSKGAKLLQSLMARDEFRGGFGEMAFLRIDSADPQTNPCHIFAKWLNNWLLDQNQRSTRHVARLHQELAEIRNNYADLSEQFLLVESCVSEYGPFPLLVFSNNVDGAHKTGNVPNLAAGDFLQQALPVRSTGLAAFELFIPPRDPEDELVSDLNVELMTAEDGQTVAVWRLEAAGSQPGWTGFILDRGVTGPAQTPVLRIWKTSGNGPPDIGLGKPNPAARACALVNGTTPLPCSLGLKIWAGLPGVRPPMLVQSVLPEGNSLARPVLISNECFPTAELVSPTPPGLDFPLLTLVEDGKELQLHPLDQYTAIACLPAVLPSGAGRAFAQFRRGHPDAPGMEVALGCAGSLAAMTALFAGDSTADGCSGWAPLSGAAPLRLSLALPHATDAPRDCYFAVRLLPGCSPSYAWARLTRLGFEAIEPG